ncbi:MAG: reverse transcriptase domain-containing protein [Firmicutes bacterium]|nr:reverse transcriptase domain-containing protein [Bacillota bacterium]
MNIQLTDEDYEKLWREFDWPAAEDELLTLQKELTKAEFMKNRESVKAIQQRIVTSLSAKALAVRHISNNFTVAGVDGVSWRKASDKMKAVMSLTNKGYKAQPAKQIAITEKYSGKVRHISVFTCYDKAMQVLYAYALDPIAEAAADFKSFGFRKGRSTHDAHSYLMKAFSFKNAPQFAVCADIKACYHSISHQWLLKHIPMDKLVLSEFLSAGYVLNGELFPTEQGISLGSNISCVLGNMVLDGLKTYIYKNLHGSVQGIDYDNGNMIRFADDIIVSVRTKEEAYRVKDIISDFLVPRGLVLSPEKTKIIHVSKGFDFLSHHYISRNGVMCATPSEKAIAKFKESLREAIMEHKGSQKALIDLLNRKLVGWANYHRVTDTTDAFKHIDVIVQGLLFQASKTKHPRWSKSQVISKYWYKENDGRYVYALPTKKEHCVIEISRTIHLKHNPIKLEPNPYLDTDYFDEREDIRAINNVTGEYKSIWQRQNGRCYYCGNSILPDQERKVVPTNTESRRAIGNLAYVHSKCTMSEILYLETEKSAGSLTNLDIENMIQKMDKDKVAPVKKLIPAYERLARFFLSQNKPSVTLTFEQIEGIMDRPLTAAAFRKNKGYWYKDAPGTMSKAWSTQNYAIDHLCMEKRKITFKQSESAKAQLIIPEIFLTQKIPGDAKFEIESFFKYIVEKYGL